MQHVTYAEYLPLVLGEEEMARHDLVHDGAIPFRYDPNINPAMINSFTTAAFRFGHSMVNGLNSYGFQKVPYSSPAGKRDYPRIEVLGPFGSNSLSLFG